MVELNHDAASFWIDTKQSRRYFIVHYYYCKFVLLLIIVVYYTVLTIVGSRPNHNTTFLNRLGTNPKDRGNTSSGGLSLYRGI